MENKRPSWSSHFNFVLASIGSAVGLGNIWRFPYIMGQNGGAIFLFVYIAVILTICFVPLIAELSVGKITKKENVGAYEEINPKFKMFGWLNCITAILIASFYFVVGGWIINYILVNLVDFKIYDFEQYFSNLTQNGPLTCCFTLLFLFVCSFFTARGVNKGIEIANKIMMPVFAIILVILIVVSLNLPNSNLGLSYMFKPDFTKINPQMFLSVLGQALFTLSIGMGALLTYGSYIDDDKNIVKSAYTIILFDTMFAILAGVMIFPAVFSFGLETNSGPGLVFITLPLIFAKMPYGSLVAILFFILLLFAALTSGISIIETPTAALIERFKISRIKSSVIVGVIVGVISILATLSFGVLNHFQIFNKNIFDFLDFTTSNVLLPFNTFILCLISGWFLHLNGKMFTKNKILCGLFNFFLKFFVPVILAILIVAGLK